MDRVSHLPLGDGWPRVRDQAKNNRWLPFNYRKPGWTIASSASNSGSTRKSRQLTQFWAITEKVWMPTAINEENEAPYAAIGFCPKTPLLYNSTKKGERALMI